jgi:hypothetical protein
MQNKKEGPKKPLFDTDTEKFICNNIGANIVPCEWFYRK